MRSLTLALLCTLFLITGCQSNTKVTADIQAQKPAESANPYTELHSVITSQLHGHHCVLNIRFQGSYVLADADKITAELTGSGLSAPIPVEIRKAGTNLYAGQVMTPGKGTWQVVVRIHDQQNHSQEFFYDLSVNE
ncbi:hypothetical protein [Tumebacillus permanentifrigoris]|uniref:hypothetical protein n=1 Tax=Tumebacillus permanentifrigoris TaxID=378543 RepID=UPI0011B21605|nr:hypothetical protein [Tumebacillus permanentifrigoris]